MQIAITTDWLTTNGGAERVIEQMCMLWPDAPLYTTVYNKKLTNRRINESVIIPTTLQKWYHLVRNHRLLLPWMPRAVESWDLRNFDVIVSSSHAVAKGCIPQGGARHICYCHTPIRYAYDMEKEYLDDYKLWGPMRWYAARQLKKIREWDQTTAKRADLFIANSTTTQERIKRLYKRDSIVLHPPVDERFFNAPQSRSDDAESYYLTVGRLVPFKRFDLLVKAANE